MSIDGYNFEIGMLLRLKMAGQSIQSFFEYKHVKKIAVYGMNTLGQLLYDEVKDCGIEVAYCLDSQYLSYNSHRVYRLENFNDFGQADMIVVCVSHYKAVTHKLIEKIQNKTNVPIYTLCELIHFCALKTVVIPFAKNITRNKIVAMEYPYLGNLKNLSTANKLLLSISNVEENTKVLAANPRYFEDVYRGVPEYSDRYIKAVFSQSEVVCDNGFPRHRDIAGEYVNIINGKRLTVSAPYEQHDMAVHFFGGCISLGYGVDDARTIPSLLQKNINDYMPDKKIRVVNHGVWGILTLNCFNLLDIIKSTPIGAQDIIILESGIFFSFRPEIMKAYTEFLADPQFEFLCMEKEFQEKVNDELLYIDTAHPSHNGLIIAASVLFDRLKNNWRHDIRESAPKAEHDIQTAKVFREVISSPSEQNELEKYVSYLRTKKFGESGKAGAIVMNCNPFTNGHLFLIEAASKEVDFLYVFLVEEDKSIFPFKDRMMLAEKGVAHLNNVRVLPSGKYIISTKTFPGYFVKDAQTEVAIDASVDIEIFSLYIAPALSITVRFAGSEPLCNVTRQYNSAMRDILPKYNIEFKVFDRISGGGEVISASFVRQLMNDGNYDKIKELVPQTTFDYLTEKRNPQS